MFNGSLVFPEKSFLRDLCCISGFFTAVLYFAQTRVLEIPFLDVLQTLVSWPSLVEGIMSLLCIWSCRHIQRILGIRELTIYFVYNAIVFLVPFTWVILSAGFRAHFSLMNFIPYSLFVFTLWRIPTVMWANPITDKHALCFMMIVLMGAKFLFSCFALASAIAGYCLWSIDAFKLRNKVVLQEPASREQNLDPEVLRSGQTFENA